MLMGQIAPRLRSAIPKTIQRVGAEDSEELVQDGIAMAAHMLHHLEIKGKSVTPGNVAYYCLLHLKSGRRSHSAGRTDTMGCGTQLDSRSCVLSLEEEVGYDPELDQAITLGDLLTGDREDPSMMAARHIDWALFVETHDYRYGVIIQTIAEGGTVKDAAHLCRLGYRQTYEIRRKLEADLREFMGGNALEDALQTPRWKAGILAAREHAACQAERRR